MTSLHHKIGAGTEPQAISGTPLTEKGTGTSVVVAPCLARDPRRRNTKHEGRAARPDRVSAARPQGGYTIVTTTPDKVRAVKAAIDVMQKLDDLTSNNYYADDILILEDLVEEIESYTEHLSSARIREINEAIDAFAVQ